jgi:hypothetical protein
MDLWEAALRENPALTEAAVNLAAAWQTQGQEAMAKVVLEALVR